MPGVTKLAARQMQLRRSGMRSEEHTSELQSHLNLVCRLLLEKKKKKRRIQTSSTRTSHLVDVIPKHGTNRSSVALLPTPATAHKHRTRPDQSVMQERGHPQPE